MKAPIAIIVAGATAVALGSCTSERAEQSTAPSPPPRVAAAPQSQPPAPQPVASPGTNSGDAITDSVITTRIKAGILSDPGMAGSDVSVNTDQGVVSLTGMIKSQEQAAIASAHAQRQDGVMRVDNMLAANLH